MDDWLTTFDREVHAALDAQIISKRAERGEKANGSAASPGTNSRPRAPEVGIRISVPNFLSMMEEMEHHDDGDDGEHEVSDQSDAVAEAAESEAAE
jgi:hypothetical protein